MRKFLVFFFSLFAVTAASFAGVHRVGTYNIRTTGMSADSLERAWDKRKASLVKMIRDSMNFDVVAMQEVSNKQHTYIKDQIGDVYAYYDGPSTGNEILYRKSKYTCMDKGYYYLAPDPTKPGAAWDAQQTRYGCWVKLKDKDSGEIFYFCATHLDLYPVSICEGARVNAEQMKEIAGNYPCVITGDMNTEPDARDPHANFKQYFGNAREMCKTAPKGSYYSFASGMNPAKASKLLDYLYVHNMEVESYFVNNSTLGRTLMPSDHMPVLCEVSLLSPMHATTHVVNNVDELKQAAKQVQAGEIIYLNEGRYDLGDSTITLANTCVMESSDKAVLTGSNQLLQTQRFSSLELRGLHFQNAHCPVGIYGALVSASGNYLKMSDCRIENCATDGLGLIYAKNCAVDINHCLFSDNSASENEGGVYVLQSDCQLSLPLTMTHTTFINNEAYHAPAVYFNSPSTAYFYGNSFVCNKAAKKGAIFIDAQANTTDIRLVNNSFIGNRIDVLSTFLDDAVGGSAIWQEMADGGRLIMVNNTVVGNYTACRFVDGTSSPDFYGGALQSRSGVLALYNNIIAGNYSSCPGRGDVSMDLPLMAADGAYNVFSCADNTNYPVSLFDFTASDYPQACNELVNLLGGEVSNETYSPPVLVYGEQKDTYALSPLLTTYAGQNIAVLTPSDMSAETINADILNNGTKTGTLDTDQLGTLRLSPSVPGAMEFGIAPTSLFSTPYSLQPSSFTYQKFLKDGQLYLINKQHETIHFINFMRVHM